MAGSFRDHFSGHAEAYARARPTYPDELFEWLAGLVDRRDLAWDAATGNGQAARSLSAHFHRVRASDASGEQVAAASPSEGVTFVVEPAENPGLGDSSVDLVTVAQAAHWFDVERFHGAVARVLRPGGVVALWCYGMCRVGRGVDPLLAEYYDSLDEFWPPERALVESGYATLPFPFAEIPAPPLSMACRWSAGEMLVYLDSWSATRRCRKATGADPLVELEPVLSGSWGSGKRQVEWPLSFRIGRKERESVESSPYRD